MLLFADENFPRSIVERLRTDGHDVLWARTDSPGVKDRALLDLAEAQARIVLTLDKDFLQIALQRPMAIRRCGVILFRLHPAIPLTLEPLVLSALSGGHSFAGHVSIVTKTTLEMIPARRR